MLIAGERFGILAEREVREVRRLRKIFVGKVKKLRKV